MTRRLGVGPRGYSQQATVRVHASRLRAVSGVLRHRPFGLVALYVDPGNGAPPKPVLLKFALPSERTDTVVAEATALTLASELGIRVPVQTVACVRTNWRRVFLQHIERHGNACPDDWARVFKHA